MKTLTRMIRSLFGLSKSSADDGETDPDEGGVTVERQAVDAETEAAVKGTGDADEGPVPTAEPEAEPIEEAEPEADVETEEPEAETVADEEAEAEMEVEEAEESEAESVADEDAGTEATVEETDAGMAATAEEPETETEAEEADAEEAEAEPETEATAGEDVSVEEINGIGPTYSERLAEAGFGTVAALAESDPATVAEAAQAPESRGEEWIDQAAGWD